MSSAVNRRSLPQDEVHVPLQPGPLGEWTAVGLHDAAERVLRHFAAPSGPLLDLGGGTGAWSQRLQRAGYEVTAVDIGADSFAARGVTFIRADLNEDFSRLLPRAFPVITCLEVIEHLESPLRFLRTCGQLLTADGVLLLTTPNIESVAGRLRFLFSGDFRDFGRDPRFSNPTHISPLQTFMFERMSSLAGLGIEYHGTHAAPNSSRWPVRILAAVLRQFVSGAKDGDAHIYVLRRSE